MTTTYTQLLNDCIAEAEDTTLEFAAYFPRALNNAEERLYRLLDIDFSEETTLSSALDTVSISKPANHRVTHNLYLLSGGEQLRLIKKTKSFLKDYWPSTTLNGTPKYYAEDDNNFYLAPTPDGVYQLPLEYEARPVSLSPSNQTNVLTNKYPDLLFYATMSNLSGFMKDPDAQNRHEAKITEALATVDNEGRRMRQDDKVATVPVGRNTKS